MKRKILILPVLLFLLTGCIQFSQTPGPEQSQSSSQEEPKEYIESVEIENAESLSKATLSFRNASTGDILNIKNEELDKLLKNEKNDPKHVYTSLNSSTKLSYGQGFVRFLNLSLTFSDSIAYSYVTFNVRAYNRRIKNYETGEDEIKILDGAFRIENGGYIKLNTTFDTEKDLLPVTPCTFKTSAKTINMEIFGAGYLESIEFYYPKETESSSEEIITDKEVQSKDLPTDATLKSSIKFDLYKNSGDRGDYPNKPNAKNVRPADTNTPDSQKIGEDLSFDLRKADTNHVLDTTNPYDDYLHVALSENALLIERLTLNIKTSLSYEYVELLLTPWYLRVQNDPKTSEEKTTYTFDSEDSSVMLNQTEGTNREFVKINKLVSPSENKYPLIQKVVFKTNAHSLKIEGNISRIKLYGINFY